VKKVKLKGVALLIIDPQNDFLSDRGVVWDLVGKGVKETKVVEHLVKLRTRANEVRVPVFYSPHYYTDEEYKNWSHLNPIDKLMFERKMFRTGSWGAEFHPQLKPDENTIVLAPHKGLSNWWTGDINIQLRQRNIQNIILAGMSANLCVESHLRDAIEHGFDVIVVKDATTGPGPEATQAAYTNYGFIANEVVTTDEIVRRLKE
jgi:nicotinamidase-related amidase